MSDPAWTPEEVSLRVLDYAAKCDVVGNVAAAVVLRVAGGQLLELAELRAAVTGSSPAERPTACATCDAALPAARATGRPRLYCPGRGCRDAARRRAERRAKPTGAIVVADRSRDRGVTDALDPRTPQAHHP